jgi:hypothetical protein
MLRSGDQPEAHVLRDLAHVLGIKKFRHGGEWIPADEYLADGATTRLDKLRA